MGGLAEYAVLPATGVFALPDAIELEDAAILGCASLTAYGAVRHGAELRLGSEHVSSESGWSGDSIVQFACAQGASQVVAVDISEEKLQAAWSFGHRPGRRLVKTPSNVSSRQPTEA